MGLLDIKGIGRVRARKLYEAGLRSTAELALAAPEKVAALLGPKISERVFKQLGKREAASPVSDSQSDQKESQSGQRTINDY